MGDRLGLIRHDAADFAEVEGKLPECCKKKNAEVERLQTLLRRGLTIRCDSDVGVQWQSMQWIEDVRAELGEEG